MYLYRVYSPLFYISHIYHKHCSLITMKNNEEFYQTMHFISELKFLCRLRRMTRRYKGLTENKLAALNPSLWWKDITPSELQPILSVFTTKTHLSVNPELWASFVSLFLLRKIHLHYVCGFKTASLTSWWFKTGQNLRLFLLPWAKKRSWLGEIKYQL